MLMIKSTEIILYVKDQEESMSFYQKLLRTAPYLHVPGMTEFLLSENCKLGLMPNDGIARILQNKTPHPETGNGIPRCELYFYVDNLEFEYQHAIQIGAKLISSIEVRSWNDNVCYFADIDGHIIAFAEKINK